MLNGVEIKKMLYNSKSAMPVDSILLGLQGNHF